jgi:deoxyribodipyrimidine photolyase
MSQTNIWWIRRDIRLHDNQALDATWENTDELLPVFIIEPELMASTAPKRRSFPLPASEPWKPINPPRVAAGSDFLMGSS